MDLTVVVLAAGQGTRMRSGRPQVLLPIAGRPMLGHALDSALSLAPTCLIAVVGHGADLVRDYLGEGIRTVLQDRQRGTAHALLQAEAEGAGRAETVLVLFGDAPLICPTTLHTLLEHHRASGSVVTFLSSGPADAAGCATVVREPVTGKILRLGEEGEGPAQPGRLCGPVGGAFCFGDAWLWPALGRLEQHGNGEFYLTDLVELAVREGKAVAEWKADATEATVVSDRLALARAEAEMRRRINERWMLAGVTMIDPSTTYIDAGVEIGSDSTLWPGTYLQGSTSIGRRCLVGPGAVIRDSAIGDGCRVELSVLEGAVMDSGSDIGPFSHLRRGAHLGVGAHVGNFGELKNSFLGPGAKMGHFSYLGDATIGENANIGAGTITCNFDGRQKNPTVVGRDAFIGSDTMLVAPVTVGDGAKTGAGSVVTRDVPPHAVVYGVPARVRREAAEEPTEEK